MALSKDEKAKLDREAEGVGVPEPNRPPTTERELEKPMRPVEEAIAEVERELNVRARCYGRWIDDGKMSRVDATDRYARLQSALVFLRQYAESNGISIDVPPSAEDVPF